MHGRSFMLVGGTFIEYKRSGLMNEQKYIVFASYTNLIFFLVFGWYIEIGFRGQGLLD
jgi:hypothetical protein